MSGPVNYDSVSRCPQSSSVYDMVRNPTSSSRNIPPVIPETSLDTIESTQQKLNREVYDRFKTTGLRLPHESYVAVAQVGKYVFLAIMVPIYLCTYGIPRWLITAAIPQVSLFIKNGSLHVGNFFVELSKKIGDLMQGALSQLLGNALNVTNHAAKRLFDFGGHLYKKMAAGIHQIQVKLQNIFKQSVRHVHATIKQTASNIGNRIHTEVVRFGAMTANLAAQLIMNPMINAMTLPLKMLKKGGETIKFKCLEAQENFNKIINTISTKLESAAESVRQMLMTVTTPVVHTMQEAFRYSSRVLKDVASKIMKPMTKIAKSIQKETENIVKHLVHAYALVENVIVTAALPLLTFLKQMIPDSVKKKLKRQGEKGKQFKKWAQSKWSSMGSFMEVSIRSSIFKGISLFLNAMNRPICAIYRMIANFIDLLTNKIKKVFSWLRMQLITAPRRIKNKIIIFAKAAAGIPRKIMMGVRLGIAWGLALGSLWTIQAHKLANDFIIWIAREDS